MKSALLMTVALGGSMAAFAESGSCLQSSTASHHMNVSSHPDGNVSMVMDTIEERAEMFEKRFRAALNSSTIDVDKRDKYRHWVRRLERQVDELTDAHERGDASGVRDDLADILKVAARIDEFISTSRWTEESKDTWRTLREDINILARTHNLSSLEHSGMRTASR